MSLARRRGQGGRISLILAFVFPAMIAAAVALAYYGYQGAQDVVSSQRRQFVNTAGARARDLMGHVDLEMNAAVNPLFRQLGDALEDPMIPTSAKCEGAVPHEIVDAYAIARAGSSQQYECVGPKVDRRRFEAEIESHNKHFAWAQVPLVSLKYVHISAGTPVLYVVTKYRTADEQAYFLIAKLNHRRIWSLWIDDALRKLGQENRVAVVDERGIALPESIFGGSEPTARERFLYEEPIGRQTLYAWRLRIAQPEESVRVLEERLKRDRLVQILLVVLSTVIIAVGLGIVFLSVVAERRASRLKSDFIANVSHELKTPLSLIRMFGEMVATGRHRGEETAREYGAIITRESERLAHLIDNVLDFARLERGKASYDFAERELPAVLDRALDVCRYRLEKEKVKLRTRIDPHLPPVRMDENAMTLVILNLVDNAMKYAADGGLVEVSLQRAPGGVVLGVRDHGAGIPRDEQARIFERFYRAQSARDRNVRGSGIGLALVRHIAEAHGGRVSVDSPIPMALGGGPGALFRVFLPAPLVEAVGSTPEGETARDDSARMSVAPAAETYGASLRTEPPPPPKS